MHTYRRFCLLILSLYASISGIANPIEVEFSKEKNADTFILSWAENPGRTYQAQYSTDAVNWIDVAPTHVNATGGYAALRAAPEARLFFRVLAYDTEAPVVEAIFPRAGSYGVPSDTPLVIDLEDMDALDLASLSATANGKSLDASSPGFAYDPQTQTLGWAPSDGTAWAGSDDVVMVSLKISDIHGHELEYTWSFETALELQLSRDYYIFGSDTALSDGQRQSWNATGGNPGEIIVNYTLDPGQLWTTDMFISSIPPRGQLTPFYGVITNVTHEASQSRYVIQYADAGLTDIITSGSFTYAPVGVQAAGFFQEKTAAITKWLKEKVDIQKNFNVSVGPKTLNFADGELKIGSASIGYKDMSAEASFAFEFNINIQDAELENAFCTYDFSTKIPITTYLKKTATGDGGMKVKPEIEIPWIKNMYVGQVGPVPVILDLDLLFGVSAQLSIGGEFTIFQTFTYTQEFSGDIRYSEATGWIRGLPQEKQKGLKKDPIEFEAKGVFQATVEPYIGLEFKLNKLIGTKFQLGLKQQFSFEGSTTWITNRNIGEAEGDIRFVYSGAGSLELSPVFLGFDDFVSLGFEFLKYQYELPARVGDVKDTTVPLGGSAEVFRPDGFYGTDDLMDALLSGRADHSEQSNVSTPSLEDVPLEIIWEKDDIPIPNKHSLNLQLEDVRDEDAGEYTLSIFQGNTLVFRNSGTVGVQSPGDYVQTPYGYSVARHEVTNADAVRVFNWAMRVSDRVGITYRTTYYTGTPETAFLSTDTFVYGTTETYPDGMGGVLMEAFSAEKILFKLRDIYFNQQTRKLEVLPGKEMLPWSCHSLDGALVYAHFLNLLEGYSSGFDLDAFTFTDIGGSYQIPTKAIQAQYSYADATTDLPNGDFIEGDSDNYYYFLDVAAWYDANSSLQKHNVGAKMPNSWGIFDALGNVAEIVRDDRSRAYGGSFADNAAGIEIQGTIIAPSKDTAGVRIIKRN